VNSENKELIKSLIETKLNESIKKNKITQKLIKEIKKSLSKEEKLKSTYSNFKDEHSWLDYEFLKLLRLIS
jgi:hypothetical protein